eukprot:298502_1
MMDSMIQEFTETVNLLGGFQQPSDEGGLSELLQDDNIRKTGVPVLDVYLALPYLKSKLLQHFPTNLLPAITLIEQYEESENAHKESVLLELATVTTERTELQGTIVEMEGEHRMLAK